MAMAGNDYTFVPPISVLSTYINISADTRLGISDRESSTRAKIMQRIARFITCAITIPFLTNISIFYNTLCFAIKGSFAILTHLLDCRLLGHTHDEYIKDINLHIAYAVRELVNNFFIGLIAIGYALDPDMSETIDRVSTNTMVALCTADLATPIIRVRSLPPDDERKDAD